jgi:Sulfotransferase family
VICHQHRCLFVHIPKTAGMSIEHAFLREVGLTWEDRAAFLLRRNDDPRRGPPQLTHLTAGEYLACGYLTEQQFRSYFKFAFVRNPWDRIVSEYKYWGHPVKIDFKTYLFKRLPAPGWTDIYRHVIPQHDFLYDESGRLLVDFVGRFETIQADFDRICERLSLPPRPLPRVNRSLEQTWPSSFREFRKWLRRTIRTREREHTFPHYTDYYDDESREFVTRMYRRDIEAFNYVFGDRVQPAAPAPS